MPKSYGGLAALDEILEKITVNTHDDHETLSAFRRVIAAEVSFPCDASVIGEPVSVVEIRYDGNHRRGLTARCLRSDGSEHEVAASDVVFPERTSAGRYLACYRTWLGGDPSTPASAPSLAKPRQKDHASQHEPGDEAELVVLSVKEKAARCRLLDADLVVTLRASGYGVLIPGEIATVRIHKRWNYAGHPYLSGDIESMRLDAAALKLVPLKLTEGGTWTPEEEYWGEEGEPVAPWAKPIIARGARQMFEMEQTMPGTRPDDFDYDPIGESNDLKEAGNGKAAHKILMELCQFDLRCLDAHAHLGNFEFDRLPEVAIRHYQAGVRIGELSLPPDFDGLLPWGLIDNRPFLRCLHGYGFCLWRLGRFKEAADVFARMLWLNPSDNQGVRFLIDEVGEGIAWQE